MVLLSDFLGFLDEENFLDFDLTEIQDVLNSLAETDAIDLPHAEHLQQLSLRGAEVITTYLGKIVKTIGHLETFMNKERNLAALSYKDPDGSRTTAEMKKCFSESCPAVIELGLKLAKAKASKIVLDKKYENLIRTHYHYKQIAEGLRKSMVSQGNSEAIALGYE